MLRLLPALLLLALPLPALAGSATALVGFVSVTRMISVGAGS